MEAMEVFGGGVRGGWSWESERVREMRVYALEGEEILVMNVGGLYKNFMGGEGFDHEEKYED